MPVQRLPRYEILLKALIEHTIPTHCDYQNLIKARNTVIACNEKVNTNKRTADIQESLVALETKQKKDKAQIGTLKKKNTGQLFRRNKSKLNALGGNIESEEETKQKDILLGRIKIKVIEARNVLAVDAGGTSDPYVSVLLENKSLQPKL